MLKNFSPLERELNFHNSDISTRSLNAEMQKKKNIYFAKIVANYHYARKALPNFDKNLVNA